MDAEIEHDLRKILNGLITGENQVLTDPVNSREKAIKDIAALVVGTIPAERFDKEGTTCFDHSSYMTCGFNEARTEMLSRWTNKEKL